MKTQKNIIRYLAVILLISFAFIPVIAKAQDNGSNGPKPTGGNPGGGQLTETAGDTSPGKGPKNNKEDRCTVVYGKIQGKIERYQVNRLKYIDRFQTIIDRLSNLITRLKDEGYDTTKLEADLATAQSKVENLISLHNKFISELEESKNQGCENEDGKFKAGIGAASGYLQQIKDAVIDIRAFFNETIKPDVLALKGEIGEKNRELNWGETHNQEQNQENNNEVTQTEE